MTLEFQYTFEDYREAFTGQAAPEKSPRRLASTVMWVLVAVAGVAWLVYLLTLDSGHIVEEELPAPPPSTAWRLATALGPSLILFLFFSYFAIRQALRGPVKPWEAVPGQKKKTGNTWFGWVLFIGLAVCFFLLLQAKTPVPGGTTAPSRGTGLFSLDFLFGLAPWLMIFAMIYILARIGRGRGMRANWEAQQHVLHGPISAEVLDTGVTFAGPLARQAFSWAYFAGFKETANLFLLYPSPFLFHMFPKRAFPSPDAIDYFRGLLITHVKHGQFLEQSSAFPVVPFAAKAPATEPPR